MRRAAGADLETRSGREWSDLVAGFELRQVALALDEGRALDGRTAEVVNELPAQGGFRGFPVPWQALEVRTGETVARGTPDPMSTRPIIDRLFPATYGITATAVGAAITSAVFRARLVAFMNANAIASPSAVRALIRPETWNALHTALVSGTAVSEWDRLTGAIPAGNFTVSGPAPAAPAGSPLATSALLTTASGGVAPFFVGLWGAIDVIRDPYSDTASGGLRITALGTMDSTVARGVQLQIMTGLQ